MRALAKRPGERYRTAEEFGRDLVAVRRELAGGDPTEMLTAATAPLTGATQVIGAGGGGGAAATGPTRLQRPAPPPDPPRRRRRGPLVAALILLVLLAAGAGAYVVFGGGAAPTRSPCPSSPGGRRQPRCASCGGSA